MPDLDPELLKSCDIFCINETEVNTKSPEIPIDQV